MDCLLDGYSSRNEVDPENPGPEWPPSPFVTSAFSSKTWRWEERSFAREGMARVKPFFQGPSTRHASVCWRGRLYVYNTYFITRLDLEDSIGYSNSPLLKKHADILIHISENPRKASTMGLSMFCANFRFGFSMNQLIRRLNNGF